MTISIATVLIIVMVLETAHYMQVCCVSFFSYGKETLVQEQNAIHATKQITIVTVHLVLLAQQILMYLIAHKMSAMEAVCQKNFRNNSKALANTIPIPPVMMEIIVR